MASKTKNKIWSIIPIFIPLLLIFSAAAPSYLYAQDYQEIAHETSPSFPSSHLGQAIHIAPARNAMHTTSGDGKGGSALVDIPPTLQFFADTQHAKTTAVLTAIATDVLDSAGIRWIRIYEDGSLFDELSCEGDTPCILTSIKIEEWPASHSYYAKTKDLGNNVVQSEEIVIEFEGLNHPPQIDLFVPVNTTPEINVSDILHFEVWASDLDNDVLSYSWTIDSVEVSTTSDWDYQPVFEDIGSHEVAAAVSDGEHETNQTWNVTVLKVPSAVNLLLNGVDDDITVTTGEAVEINGMLIIPNSSLSGLSGSKSVIAAKHPMISAFQQKQQPQKEKQGDYYIELWLDGQLVASDDYTVSYNTSFASPGAHTATVFYLETQNYLSSFETHFITVIADSEAPTVDLVYPLDGSTISAPNVTITYNVTDNLDSLLDCSIWSNTSGTWQVDGQQQTASGSSNSWNYIGLASGVYEWNVQCQDSSGNSAFAPANWTFIIDVDSEPPMITFIPPTPADGSTIATNWTFINTTITDNVAVDSAILEWNGVNESMQGAEPNYYLNKTDLTDGLHSYKVYARDTLGNWNVSETRTLTVDTSAPTHDIAVESLTLLKEVAGINKSIEASTAYWNDSIHVLALVSNVGTANETGINITLQNNIGIIDSQLIDLDAGQTDLVSFVWSANPDGWHTIKVRAEPVAGETNIIDNELSEDVLVWEVCNVIDCSVFGPKTASNNYTLGQPFLVRSMIQNLWNNETFKDLKVELTTDTELQIIGPWSSVQYVDLDPSQFAIANWNVTSISTGNYSITTWAGNHEYNETKEITIQ